MSENKFEVAKPVDQISEIVGEFSKMLKRNGSLIIINNGDQSNEEISEMMKPDTTDLGQIVLKWKGEKDNERQQIFWPKTYEFRVLEEGDLTHLFLRSKSGNVEEHFVFGSN